RGNIQAHGGHQHAGHNLVAIRDADHAVETMRANHGLDAISDEFAGRERVFHSAVAHRDAVVDANGVENERYAAGFAHETLDELPDLVEVGVAGNAVRVTVGDRDERLVEVVFGFDAAGRPQQAAMRCALSAAFDCV